MTIKIEHRIGTDRLIKITKTPSSTSFYLVFNNESFRNRVVSKSKAIEMLEEDKKMTSICSRGRTEWIQNSKSVKDFINADFFNCFAGFTNKKNIKAAKSKILKNI